METSVRLPRLAVSAIGVAIVAASALAIVAPASGATPEVTYITAAQVGTSPITAGGFQIVNGNTPVSGLSGLSINGYARLGYGFAAPLDMTTGTALQSVAAASAYQSPNSNVAQPIIYWTDQSGAVQTLTSTTQGGAFNNPASMWVSSASIRGYTNATLSAYDLALSSETATVEIVGVGVFLFVQGTGTYSSLTANGAKFSFLPEPVSTAPTTLTATQYASTGITVTTSGFLPNETGIVVGLGNGGTGGPIGTVDADAQGVITYARIEPTPANGSYTLSFFGSVSDPQVFEFTVTGAAGSGAGTPTATAAAAALAATGTDSFAPLAAGGVLLLGGAALAIVAIRRRRTV